MPDPSLPVSVEAVRELPEEIERAMEAFEDAAQEHGWEAGSGSAENTARAANDRRVARNALATAILSRLTAAEASRDAAIQERDALNLHIEDITEARVDAMRMVQYLSQGKKAALARVERLEKALEFYADEQNYRMNAPLDPNSSWFDGNNRARAALSDGEKE